MPATPRVYKDLNLSFNAHPVTGDISVLKGVDAIKRSVRNLVLMGFYETPFMPDLGSGVVQSLFEVMTIATKHQLQAAVTAVLNKYEPRVTVQEVRVNVVHDYNTVVVGVIFTVRNILDPITVDITLQRVR